MKKKGEGNEEGKEKKGAEGVGREGVGEIKN